MKTNPFIKKLRAIVLENYPNEHFGVKELALEYGISRSQLYRKLKFTTGQSISQFIREIRLDESLKMLQNEDLSASEVSYKVGFNSPSYFNTCFHDYFGYTPGEVKHKMELAKGNNEVLKFPKREKKPFRKRLNYVVGLTIVIILIATFFVYNNFSSPLLNKENSTLENKKSIAVLPIKNWSGDVDLEHVSDGLTDAIISKLAGIEDMERVIPFTSIQKYKDAQLNAQEIAEELEVAYVLEGSFKLSGGLLQCKVNLVEVKNNSVIWTKEYNRKWNSEDVFKMQADVAKSVADNLKLDLNKADLSSIQYVPTKNTEAYNHYLRGKFQHEKLSPDGFKNAIALYEKAIALDSTFFLPYLGLTESYTMMGFVWGGDKIKDAVDNANKYYKLASKVFSSDNYEHLKDLRKLKMSIDFNYNWEFETVYEDLMNNGAKGGFGFDMARKFGEHQLAIKIGENSGWANEGDGLYFLSKSQVLMLMGKEKEARQILNEFDPLNEHHYFYLMESAKIYYYLDDMAKSKIQLERFLNLYDNNPAQILWIAAVHAVNDGNMGQVNNYLNLLKGYIETNESGSPAWFLAMYYCHLKDYDNVFKWLEKSYDLREVEMTWLKEEPLLQPVRNDPRYIELYDKVGFSKAIPLNP